MPSTDRAAYQRYNYIYEMERLYLQASFSDSAMGERLGTDRTNIYRIRRIMVDELHIPIEEDPDQRGHYFIPQHHSIMHIPLSREQAAVLYLAGRRMQQQTRVSQEAVATALEKLARPLPGALAERLVSAAQIVLNQEQDERQQQIFSTLVHCWLNRYPVHISHRVLHGRTRHYLIKPYLLEPAVWGDGIYLIGHSDYHGKLATFKTARIEKAVQAIGDPFEVPTDFNIDELLKYAWGIWHADEEPHTVTLRFNAQVAPRVMESIWHPQQTITQMEDKGVIWQAPIAEWREMLPWTRGWGADVEVLEPRELREEVAGGVKRMMRLYGLADITSPVRPHFLLWAKTDRKTQRFHPLICHLIDVAQVAHKLWSNVLTDSFRSHLAAMLNLEIEAAGRLLAFWAALHDIGKASPAFQRKVGHLQTTLEKAGIQFPKLFSNENTPHGLLSTCFLETLLVTETTLDLRAAKRIAWALGGHHGVWPEPGATKGVKTDQKGEHEWNTMRKSLIEDLKAVLRPPELHGWIAERKDENVFLALFSGFVSVADWIGSSETYFSYTETVEDLHEYATQAAQKAQSALESLGWIGYQSPSQPCAFQTLFPFAPNDVQDAAIQLAATTTGPALTLIETPTGSGKTEAALYLADSWASKDQQRGLYVAMPTMATSNQMHKRVASALYSRYEKATATPLLIHSQARWIRNSPPPQIVSDDEQATDASTQSMTWFLPRKRSLLAPFGVGTIDQSLISVLQTRHFFVRLFALSHKTVIFDEVHAYDTYMSALFEHLLAWLSAVGASVILLSATLPASTRRRLVQAYAGNNALQVPDAPYPAISHFSSNKLEVISLPPQRVRAVTLTMIPREPVGIISELREALSQGGCAAVICNTVKRSQEIYRAIQNEQLVDNQDLYLFHARTPFGWRNEIEQQILEKFGKSGKRPDKAIVVATQVIEQSLDLDFDIMVSELAPIDLLLQRAGRLHRHERLRPLPLTSPRLIIAVDEEEEFPGFGNDTFVYEPYILLRSLAAIKDQTVLSPDVCKLIEFVYDDTSLDKLPSKWQTRLFQAQQEMVERYNKNIFEARNRLVPSPDSESLSGDLKIELEEDMPAVHVTLQALTRLGPPSISLVCLHHYNGQLWTEPNGQGTMIELGHKPDSITTERLAQCTVSISDQKTVKYFLEQKLPPGWYDHALLRDHRLAIFTAEGLCDFTGLPYPLHLTRELGLEIIKP
ncbi:MAG: CRISPR-associated helicase Cas3' [Anaerolineae bacterium]